MNGSERAATRFRADVRRLASARDVPKRFVEGRHHCCRHHAHAFAVPGVPELVQPRNSTETREAGPHATYPNYVLALTQHLGALLPTHPGNRTQPKRPRSARASLSAPTRVDFRRSCGGGAPRWGVQGLAKGLVRARDAARVMAELHHANCGSTKHRSPARAVRSTLESRKLAGPKSM